MINETKPCIAVSTCLLGDPVRYNACHSQDRWITNTLGKYVDFVPFCPEMAMGLGTPREEIQLVYKGKDRSKLYLRSKKSKEDLTDLAQETFKKMDEDLSKNSIDGFIMMRKSPSCGHYNVKTESADGSGPVVHSQGLYATHLEKGHPSSPFIDSGKLKNYQLREHFIKCVFAHHRLVNIEKSVQGLQLFHQRYKYIIMEHSHKKVSQLGTLAANSEKKSFEEIYDEYKSIFMETISTPTTIKTRANVFMHLMGYLKKQLTSEEKSELLNLFEEYKQGIHGFAVPLKLLELYLKSYQVDYLLDQYYFNPYPKEIKLLKVVE